MPSTINKILDSFLFPTTTPIVGPPNFKTISKLHMKLNSNAASVQSNLGDGMLSLLYFTVFPIFYTTLSSTEFVVPVNPGSEPIIPDGATGPAIADPCYSFQLAKDIFTDYDNTDKALHQIILASVENLYVRSLCHRYIKYGRTTTHQPLNQLYAVYTNISPVDLQLKDARLRTPYDANHSIKTIKDQLETAVKYVAARNTP